MKSTHIKADYHLPLRPGTNVGMINALAHTIVTEGLAKDDFVRERCDIAEFERWRNFIVEERNSPEAMEPFTGVPAADIRAAARLYAAGPNSAIYYGLGVTEHSQGSTMVIGMANISMLTGNIGRRGVGVNPLRGQNNVQGSCRVWVRSRMNLPAIAIVSNDCGAGIVRKRLGRAIASRAPACVSPT